LGFCAFGDFLPLSLLPLLPLLSLLSLPLLPLFPELLLPEELSVPPELLSVLPLLLSVPVAPDPVVSQFWLALELLPEPAEPEEPDEPAEPDEPEEPAEPDEPDEPLPAAGEAELPDAEDELPEFEEELEPLLPWDGDPELSELAAYADVVPLSQLVPEPSVPDPGLPEDPLFAGGLEDPFPPPA
jgi:hypothetical protein